MDRKPKMPELVRLYIRQCLIGFALAAVFVGLLLGLDVAGLRGLVLSTSGGLLAVFLLFFFNGLVFAGVQFAIAIMRMGEEGDDRSGGRRDDLPRALGQPIRVAVGGDPVQGSGARVAGPQRP
jgi:hypothetical protein